METDILLGTGPAEANTLLLVGGDLCARTAQALAPERWACIGLRRRTMAAGPGARVRWLRADLGDPGSVAEALAAVSDIAPPPITHLLYAPAPDARTPEAYARAYPQGLRALLDALPRPDAVRRCVLVDSSAIWGPVEDDRLVDEDTPPAPADFRGAAMLDAEALLHARLPGRGVALRLSGLYGPGRLRLADGLRAGRIAAPDGPGHWANRIHVDDAARACAHLLALAAPLPCYIGTDDRPTPTAALYEALARMAGGPAPAREARPPDGKRLSNARLRASGWTPAWPDALEGYAACLGGSSARRVHCLP
ncbi:NAD-dependent epimerase/dehydratase family protein [uncultured Castellaniella sp.]|uniref:NAD-dependent epimerase/dehydratase family protein n=1 Tax=uncultured Castellaniella sp. TaxID=647907 RepID=UPI0026137F29|nr:NAD-dependent epimerase/dehydratase family protein [uncultured Castellaniella sp.]